MVVSIISPFNLSVSYFKNPNTFPIVLVDYCKLKHLVFLIAASVPEVVSLLEQMNTTKVHGKQSLMWQMHIFLFLSKGRIIVCIYWEEVTIYVYSPVLGL